MTIEVFLTPKTLSEYLELAHKSEWTGRIDVNAFDLKEQNWSIYFLTGELIWCTGGEHQMRRWRRLLYQYCPHICVRNINWDKECADYYQLRQWVEIGLLMVGQAKALIQSNFAEVLLDILQQETSSGLTFRTDELSRITAYLPPVDFQQTLNHTKENWKQWCLAGLKQLSPNRVPLVLPHQQKILQKQINLKLYRELLQVIDGDKSLRDIALLLRQPLLCVALSLNSYFRQGSLEMYGIIDLAPEDPFSPLSPTFNISPENLLSSSGVFCSRCGYDSNSITESLCQRCNSPLAALALPAKQTTSIYLKPLIPTLLLVLVTVGGYFIWHNWVWNSLQESGYILPKSSINNCKN